MNFCRVIKRSSPLLAIAFLFFGPLVNAKADENPDSRLTAIEGTVDIKPQGGDTGFPPSIDTPLEEGDMIQTGPGSSAEISLNGQSVILLGENSTFQIKTQRDKQFDLFLAFGSLVAKIKSLRSDERLSVQTPIAVASVRGTEFAVLQEENGETTTIGIFDEGELSVQKSDGGDAVMLKANEELEVSRNKRAMKRRELTKMAQFRSRIEHSRERAKINRRNWNKLSPQERRQLRQNWLNNQKKTHPQQISPKHNNDREKAPARRQNQPFRKR